MKDKDTHILSEAYASLYAGKIEEDDEEKNDTSLGSDSDDKDDKEEKSEDSEKSDDKDYDDKDSDDSDDSKDSDDDDDSEDMDYDSDDSDDSDSSSSAGGDSGIQSKVKQLQKQYNDLLVDAFEKYAAECIENALDGVESSFGENITDILDTALDELKGKILGDLGVEDSPAIGGMDMGMGGMDVDLGGEPEVEFGSEVGGVPTITVDSGDEGGSDEGPQDDEEEEVEEEGCGMAHYKGKEKKKKKIVKESNNVANFYGFV